MQMQTLVLGSMVAMVVAGCDKPDSSQRAPATAPPVAPTPAVVNDEADREKERAEEARKKAEEDAKREATAEIKGAEPSKLEGEAKFTVVPEGVRMVVEFEDAPVGIKGAHIHEKDDCSDIANKSMGDHFNPTMAEHGLPDADSAKNHMGDMGNITIAKDGAGRLEFVFKGANLKEGDRMSLLGKSIVVHEAEDKGTVESAGKPIACGAIKLDS